MSKHLSQYKKQLSQRSTKEPYPFYGDNTNLFGSIAKSKIPFPTTVDFIPADGNSNIIDLGGQITEAQWLGLNSKNLQYWAYMYCAPLAAVIDRLAEADTNGRIELLNMDGTTKEHYAKVPHLNRVMKLLAKPNPLQTWEEFNSQQVVLCKIFGYCPVFAVCPTGLDKTYSKSLWNLNPYYCQVEYNTEFEIFDDTKGSPIKNWNITIGSKQYSIPAEDVLLVKDGFVDSLNPGLGLPNSKVAGLDYFVSNICAAMEADNVLLKKKGPLGIFSHDPKPDMAGWMPMKPEEQDELQNDLKKYGLSVGQLQYVVSKQPIKWNSMSFNVQELMTKETVRQGIDGICDRFGYPAELMSGKNATYENRNSAEKFLYQNNIIPFSLRRMARYDVFFDFGKESRLSMDYDHLPVLQEDIMRAGQAARAHSESLEIDWLGGMITWNEWRMSKDMDTVAGMDIYYPEWAKKNGINLNPEKPKKDEVASKDTSVKK